MNITPRFSFNALKVIIPTADLKKVTDISSILLVESKLYSRQDYSHIQTLINNRLATLENAVL